MRRRSRWSAARYGNAALCAGYPFVPNGSKDHRTDQGSGQKRRRCSRAVPLVLPNLTGRGEQIRVAPDEEVVFEIGLERFGGYMSFVHVHCEEVNVAPDVSAGCRGTGSRACATERPEWSTPYSRQIASDTLLESLDASHLHGRIQGGFLCEQGGIDDGDLLIGVDSASHECKRRLTAHQTYLYIDAVDQEFILQKQIHV